jgi:hypothetical protein
MKWLNKLKGEAKNILKEHIVSIAVFFVGMLIFGINADFFDNYSWTHGKSNYEAVVDALNTLAMFFILMSTSFVLCESNYLYKKSIGKIESLKEIKKSWVYLLVTILSTGIFGFFSYTAINYKAKWLDNYADQLELFTRFTGFYMVVIFSSALFFMYKRSGFSFETFAYKAVIGLVKAGVVYGTVAAGVGFILLIFNSLFFDPKIIAVIYCLITALVGFPAALVGLTHFEEENSKFAKTLFGSVFTAITAVAYLIVYAYIIKILVKWTFPSNEVFSITTGLFVAGAFVWTTAQGCTEGKLNKAVRLFPLFFIPFIVMQIMCLYMRVAQYGLTIERYLGIVLIVFEIIYVVYYLVRLLMKKGLGGILFPLAIVIAAVCLVVPKVNAFAAVTASQKKVVEKFIAEVNTGSDEATKMVERAESAYRTLKLYSGFEGRHYVKKLNEQVSDEKLKNWFDEYKVNKGTGGSLYDNLHTTARYTRDKIELRGYKYLSEVDIYHSSRTYGDFDPANIALFVEQNGDDVVVDLSELVNSFEEASIDGASTSELEKFIEEPIEVNGGLLYITYFKVDPYSDSKDVEHFELEGYYLYN